eukprot:GHVU01055054.1.p1 GENE.GHVU01055054.1~~GHVU01055054.1.p1  ORF type:complete len:135 (+),score=3.13 GHVU01055054.1:362-766(+)
MRPYTRTPSHAHTCSQRRTRTRGQVGANSSHAPPRREERSSVLAHCLSIDIGQQLRGTFEDIYIYVHILCRWISPSGVERPQTPTLAGRLHDHHHDNRFMPLDDSANPSEQPNCPQWISLGSQTAALRLNRRTD